MRSADDFLRGRSCGSAEPRAQSPGPQPELSARNPTQESYRKHRNCRDRKNSRNRTAGTTEAAGIQGSSDRRSRRPKRKKPSGSRKHAGAGGFGTECPGRNVPAKASVLLRLRCGAGIPARSAAPFPTSRRAVRPAPRPSRPPGRRNRADPYRRGSGDRRSRSPSGSPADRPCPGWRPR